MDRSVGPLFGREGFSLIARGTAGGRTNRSIEAAGSTFLEFTVHCGGSMNGMLGE